MIKTNGIAYSRFLLTALALCMSFVAGAQSLAQQKAGLRYEVEAKRMGTDVNSDDALPRSREFKRIDSTYYVGWMYEGVYKYNHAADYLGYKNAAIPLERCLGLLERDYRKELKTRTSDLMTYFPAYRFQLDYTMVAYYLMNCYSNMEDGQRVFDLLQRVVRLNFQRDYYMDAYNFLGWTVHRNRFYTSDKYAFLKNSIKENEALAHRYLDSGLRRTNANKRLNATIFPPGYEQQEKLGVYHYKSILYSYALNIDSAAYYYELMRSSSIFPHNNYATFRSICGDFREAESEYKLAVAQDAGDKRLKEWAYYTSTIDIYKSRPRDGVELLKGMVKANGSTPGFGWYNIALARCMLYDGQNAEAYRYVNKAAQFKELHLGTTLSQAHYDFSVQLIKLMHKLNEWEMQKFENRNWWYNPRALGNMTRILGEKYMLQFLIINQFAQNPERDRVIYKLFSTESTVSWDEVWYLIRDFSTRFFLERFQKEANTDERQYIRKYFRFFVAKLKMEQGDYKEARIMLDAILRDPNIDADYEKLFLARIAQAQAKCAQENEDQAAFESWMTVLYDTYPQLVPYTGMQMKMNLHIAGQRDETVVARLKDCNIDWVTDPSVPQAYIIFSGSGDKKKIDFYVVNRSGKYIVPRQSMPYQKAEKAGTDIAYRLFNIGSKAEEPETEAERTTL